MLVKINQIGVDPPRITALTLPAAEPWRRSISATGARAAANQLHVAAAIDRPDRQTTGRTDTLPLHRRSPLETDSVNNTKTSRIRLGNNQENLHQSFDVETEYYVHAGCRLETIWKASNAVSLITHTQQTIGEQARRVLG